MFDVISENRVPLTLYTDTYVVQGTVRTRQRRVSDILNMGSEPFLILEGITMEEFGTGARLDAAYGQVNLDSVLFAVALTAVDPTPELRTPKSRQHALVAIPPFKVSGVIHLSMESDLFYALEQLTQRFIPVTGASFWSDPLGISPSDAAMVAVNASRTQILTPFAAGQPTTAGVAETDLGQPGDRPA